VDPKFKNPKNEFWSPHLNEKGGGPKRTTQKIKNKKKNSTIKT
jgi:hypothetical protein